MPTNLVIIDTVAPAAELAAALARDGVLVTEMGDHTIRCVTYLGVSTADVRRAADVIARRIGA